MVDYNENFKIIYYSEFHNVDIIEEKSDHISKDTQFHMYFNNISDFVRLIKSNDKFCKEVKELLKNKYNEIM